MTALNFRATAGYVTDGAGQTYVVTDENYPTLRDGVNFGWVGVASAVQERDRSTGIDVRLAGMHSLANTNPQAVFATDSGSGTFDVALASGDQTSEKNNYVEIVEINSSQVVQSVLATVAAGVSSLAGEFIDAAGTLHTSAANWVSSNATVQVTVAAGNHLGLRICDPAASAVFGTAISHFAYTEAASSASTTSDVIPPANNSFVDLTSVAAAGDRITTTPDLAIGDHVRHEAILYQGATPTGHTVVVNADGTYTLTGANNNPIPDGTYTFEARVYDDSDQTWGAAADQTVVIDSGVVVSFPLYKKSMGFMNLM